MKRKAYSIFFILIVSILVVRCKKEPIIIDEVEVYRPTLPAVAYLYDAIDFPASFDAPPLNFINSIQSENQITNDGATLGRVLFYDKQLSKNSSVSCASCHNQKLAFSDGAKFSTGLYGSLTDRNSMAIMNTRFSYRFFWDDRAMYLENQTLMPIQNHIEMDMDINVLVDKLSKISYYPNLFNKAFGTIVITSERISKALSQFLHSLVSYNSKYDQGFGVNFTNFTQLEKDGQDLFMSGTVNCNNCHSTANFYSTQALVNGLDELYADNGIGDITNNPEDEGRFKVPTLRNIALTAPYMHDGRFSTLEEVIEHYNSGIKAHPNLDDRLTVEGHKGGTPKMYNMSEYQKASLVAFLKTLTDEIFINDPKFGDPFK